MIICHIGKLKNADCMKAKVNSQKKALEDMPKQKTSELIDLLFKKEMQKEVREADELVRN